MGYSLIYTPVLHFDDINGRPLVGGKLYTYKAGTSTPAPTYRNSAGTELNENPILLNERGECVCFLDDGLKYKFVLKDSLENTIWEQDNVSIPAGGGGGSGPVYVQESHTSSDSNVTIASQKTTCTFDHNLENFAGELHVRFQNSGQAATVALYVNDEYNDKIVSTLPVMSGMTHLMVPVSVKSGSLRAEVTFATASTPSSVKFDLVGYNLVASGGGGSQDASNLTFVSGGSSGGGSVTKTITLPHKYKNAFGGFISFIVRSSSPGLTRTVNWEYTVAGSGISYEKGRGQTIVVNYETKVTMPFIVSRDTPFNQITIKFNGTSTDTSIYDADVFFYAEEVAEP